MKYVLGIDSGGTKFLVRACDLDGKTLGEYTGTACNHYYLPEEEVKVRINHHIDACLHTFGGRREDCAYLLCGTTGLDSPDDEVILDRLYGELSGFTCPVKCVNDAEVAHYAATGGVGVLVIAGTGSIAFGRNAAGEEARAGGWFFTLMGDEGSGAYKSKWALHYVSRWFDGVIDETPLIRMTREKLALNTRKDLLELSMKMGTAPWPDPGLSKIVDDAAAEGDPYARSILEDSARWCFEIADAVIQKLGMHKQARFRVGAWGSSIVKSPLHFASFKRLLEEKYDNVDVLIPDCDAATGAVRMALARLKGAQS